MAEKNSRQPAVPGHDRIFNVIGVTILVLSLIVTFYPLLWMVMNSFKTNSEIITSPLKFPTQFSLEVFKVAWERANFDTALVSSLKNSAAVVVLTLVTGSLAGFAFARNRFPGDKFILRVLVLSIIVSAQLVMIPLFFVVRDLKIYDTLWSTIFSTTALNLPICIYLFQGFFKEIPYEIEESAMIDGCGRLRFYYRFIIPLSKPIAATVIIFSALWSWNEYLLALTFLKSNPIRTIPLQLQNFFGRWSTQYDQLFAALSISIVPLLIIYVFLQKAFIKGMTAGAVKF